MATNNKNNKFDLSDRLHQLIGVLVAGILAVLILGLYLTYQGLPANQPQEMSVSAQGKVFAKPDIALITIGLETEGKDVADIMEENTRKMNAVLQSIKDLGIEEKDIQTTRYNLSPIYDWTEREGRIFKGYVLTQQVKIKIRDFSKIGPALNLAAQSGANLVGDLQFTIDDMEKLRADAREQAIEKAKDKASQISEQSGLKLVKIINIYEDIYYTPDYRSMGGIGGAVERISAAPEIEAGEQEITVNVNLIYRIK